MSYTPSKITYNDGLKILVDKTNQAMDGISGVEQEAPSKYPVRVATTANITLSATQTIDAVAVVAGDRVLVKDQTDKTTNGIYVVATGAWTRATDFDTAVKAKPASTVFVQDGTTNADSGWILITNSPITIGTTLLDFTQFSGAGMITAGTGLSKTGNTISIATNGVTDTMVGNRTIDTAIANPTASVGTLTQLFSWLANRIKAITGATNWYDAPATTLAAANTHATNTTNPHSVTATQVGAIATGAKGTANGVASLDAGVKVPVAQLPIATASAVGAVKGSASITIAADGTMSAASTYNSLNSPNAWIG